MANREFKKAVDVSKKIDGLSQPKNFLKDNSKNKQWEEYEKEIEKQQSDYEQVIYSVAMEPSLREAIKIAGKNKGKLQGGAKAVIREALIDYFRKNKEYFD